MRGGAASGGAAFEYQVFERGSFDRHNRWSYAGFRCAR